MATIAQIEIRVATNWAEGCWGVKIRGESKTIAHKGELAGDARACSLSQTADIHRVFHLNHSR